MNKRIPELLECGEEIVITDEVRKMFDPEEIKELTMSMIYKSEKRAKRTKRFSMILIAAALTMALTASAFAAYRYIADQFDDYFGGLSEQQAEFIEQIGTSEMSAVTANGTTITPLAMIGDDVRCYMKFRLEAPDWTQFDMTEDELEALHIWGDEDGEWYSIVDENGEKLPVYSENVEWIDAEPGDNVLELVVCFSTGANGSAHFDDGKSRTLTIPGIWREGLDKEYTKVLDGPWSFDIVFHSGVGVKTLDVDGLPVKSVEDGVEIVDDGRSITLRTMSISPLTLSYGYDYTISNPNVIPGPGTVQIVMKDGSIVEVFGGQGSDTGSYCEEDGIIQTPIDLDEVDYIQFGDQQIRIS